MSKIDDLLAKMCPKGVIRLPISDLCTTFSGGFIKKTKQDISFEFPVYNGGAEPTGFYDEFNSPANSIAISGRGSIGFVNWVTTKFWAGNSCHVLQAKKKELDNKFLYYYLKHHEVDLRALKNTGSIPALNLGPLLKFLIPLPPLEIQKEIVVILDKFTELEAELEAELEVRKMQYEFYRKSLLTFDINEIPTSFLGDIYEFQYGKGNTIPTTGGKYPVYGSNGVVGSHYEFNSKDAPVIGHIGAYAGIVNWAEGEHFVTYNGVICKIKDGFDPRFGYHLLMKQNLRELANEGSQPFVSYDKLKSVIVQLPNIEKQIELALLLDSLENLTTDISVGLPAEIKSRRQQYEYYRNKLLTFKELDVA